MASAEIKIMDVLPKEIQMIILSKVDGCGLVHCSRTCRLWNYFSKQLMANFDHWLRICLREIPVSMLVDLTGLMGLTRRTDCYTQLEEDSPRETFESLQRFSSDYWKGVYVRYISAGLVRSGVVSHRKMRFMSGVGNAISLRLKGSTIVTGHEHGSVVHWWQVFSTVVKHRLMATHRSCVNSVDIIEMDTGKTMSEGERDYESLVAVSGANDRTVLIQTLGSLNNYSYQRIYPYSAAILEVSAFGRFFTAVGHSVMMNEQPVWKVDSVDHPVATYTKAFSCCEHICSGISTTAMWGNKVYIGDVFGFISEFDLDTACLKKKVEVTSMEEFTSMPKQLVLQGENLVVLFVSGNIFARPEGESSFQLLDGKWMSRFGGLPMKLALRGSLLAIGLKGGLVVMYHLPNQAAWKSQRFTVPAVSITTCNTYIHSMDIGYDGNRPFLVVTGDGQCLEFFTFGKHPSP